MKESSLNRFFGALGKTAVLTFGAAVLMAAYLRPATRAFYPVQQATSSTTAQAVFATVMPERTGVCFQHSGASTVAVFISSFSTTDDTKGWPVYGTVTGRQCMTWEANVAVYEYTQDGASTVTLYARQDE